MGQAREEIRPRDRPGIGVGDVDFQLRDQHQRHGQRNHQERQSVRQNEAPGGAVHHHRLPRFADRRPRAHRQHRQQRSRGEFHDARHHPTRPGDDHRAPPRRLLALRRRRQKPQIIDLLADLHDQRHDHRQRRPEIEPAEPRAKMHPRPEIDPPARGQQHDGDQRRKIQHQPQPARAPLKPADKGDAERDHRQHHAGRNDVAEPFRNPEAIGQHSRQDRCLDREKNEGERGIDQRGDGRAQIAEPGAARQQIDIDAGTRRDQRNRPGGQRDDQPGNQDRRHRIGEAVAQGDRAADRFERQERGGAEGGIRHAPGRESPRTQRGEAQRVILHRFVRNPLIIRTTRPGDTLAQCQTSVPFHNATSLP